MPHGVTKKKIGRKKEKKWLFHLNSDLCRNGLIKIYPKRCCMGVVNILLIIRGKTGFSFVDSKQESKRV